MTREWDRTVLDSGELSDRVSVTQGARDRIVLWYKKRVKLCCAVCYGWK